MNTVVMPTLNRPEMLALALEHLDRTNQDIDVRIFLDHTSQERLDEVEYVRDTYYPNALIFHADPHIQTPSGMWNILNALLQGYNTGAEYIYIVEEDVCVYPDFFKWHEQAQKDNMWFATCGRVMRNYPNYRYYTNPGSCFERSMLELVIPHINYDMFSTGREYMDRVFGPMDESSDLDDGLIRRVARQHGLQVKYPDTPKCSHIGFRGYNKLDIFQNPGDLKTRIEGLRKMLPNIDPNGRYSRDFEPIL